jgi:single-strand DNA-binding protein
MNFNKAIIAGNITRDPETRTLPNGQPVTNFGVATNRRFTDQEGNRQETTEFHNIVAFGKWADICSRYLKKGMPVLVEGRLQTRSWQGQDGVKRSRTEIIMEFMQMGPRSTTPSETMSQPSKGESMENLPKEEIPVIEAEESPTLNSSDDETIASQPKEPAKSSEESEKPTTPAQKTSTKETLIESEDKGQVEVKNIPF